MKNEFFKVFFCLRSCCIQSEQFLHLGKIIYQARHAETEKIHTEQNNHGSSRHLGLHSERISWNKNFYSCPCLLSPVDALADRCRDSKLLHSAVELTGRRDVKERERLDEDMEAQLQELTANVKDRTWSWLLVQRPLGTLSLLLPKTAAHPQSLLRFPTTLG